MSISHCACPSCLHVFRVPADVLGKKATCPKCRARLVVRGAGGRTLLMLAGVDGNAPTMPDGRPAPIAAAPLPSTHALTPPGPYPERSRTRIPKGTRLGCLALGLVLLLGGGTVALVVYANRDRIPDQLRQALRISEDEEGVLPLLAEDDRTEEEKIRWKKLRKQISGFWVFVYHKPKKPLSGDDGWLVNYPAEQDRQGRYWGRRRFETAISQALDAWEGPFDRTQAEERAFALAQDLRWDVTVVIDFSGALFPNALAWFYHDGASCQRSDQAPKNEYAVSLHAFLLHLH